MKLTNKLNLPEPIVRAVTRDPYSKGDSDFSVTELLQPPRARALTLKHWDEIEEDVSDRIFALMGQIGHLILERAGDSQIVERRFKASFGGEVTVSGQADLFMDKDGTWHGIDYKFCSIWTSKDGVKPEWEQQANMLRYLAQADEKQYLDAESWEIVAIFRDWSKPKAQREENYPQNQVQVLPVKLWSLDETRTFIAARIVAHQNAMKELPLCTDEERWATKPVWAVKKKGNKRADRLYDNEETAVRAAQAQGMIVEFRPPEYKRCANYCSAYNFCSQSNPNAQPQ